MSREQFALRAHRALAWAAPVVLGLVVAYLCATEPWPTTAIAVGIAAAAGVVVWVVLDYRHLQAMRRWGELLVEYRTAAVDAGHDEVRARMFGDLLRAAVLDLHRPTWPTNALDPDDAPDVPNYVLVMRTAEPLPEHECITELVHIDGAGWPKCDPVAGVHLLEACIRCGNLWPCATAAAVMPRTCKHCGCSDLLACDGGCSWVSEDECSACVPLMATVTVDVDDERLARAMGRVSIDDVSIAEGGAE